MFFYIKKACHWVVGAACWLLNEKLKYTTAEGCKIFTYTCTWTLLFCAVDDGKAVLKSSNTAKPLTGETGFSNPIYEGNM